MLARYTFFFSLLLTIGICLQGHADEPILDLEAPQFCEGGCDEPITDLEVPQCCDRRCDYGYYIFDDDPFRGMYVPDPVFYGPRPWIKGEYLGWVFRKSDTKIPLVTSGSFADRIPGALGQPHTRVRLGHEDFDFDWQNGFQVSFGSSLNWSETVKLEVSYFLFLKNDKTKHLHTSGEPGSRNLAVPIFDVTGLWGLKGHPGETVFLLAGPLGRNPGFEAHFKLRLTNQFQGAEINGSYLFYCWNDITFEAIGGFRWLQLEEVLSFKAITNTVTNFAMAPGTYNFHDHFKTLNNFYGGQIGIKGRYEYCDWFGELTTKVALGVINNHVDIHGKTETLGGNLFYETAMGTTFDFKGGVFAQPTNRKHRSRDTFGVVFESGVRAGYRLTSYLELYLGYTFLLINDFTHPGELLNRKINPTRTELAKISRKTVGRGKGPIPFGQPGPAETPRGPREPDFHLRTRLFWAQGLTAGLNLLF